MRLSVALVLPLVACAASPDDEPASTSEPTPSVEPATMPPPPGCFSKFTLVGTSDSATPTSVTFAIGSSDGIDLCVTLDARDNKRLVHFVASTEQEFDTSTSMFQLTLLDKDGALLQEGWDVTVDGSPPTAFANLEHDVTEGTVVEVTLHIIAKCVPLGTSIDLALFEPHP
jgi:hypothetical protein